MSWFDQFLCGVDTELKQLHYVSCCSTLLLLLSFSSCRSLDRGRKGYISAEELMGIPELSINPLAQRLVSSPAFVVMMIKSPPNSNSPCGRSEQ